MKYTITNQKEIYNNYNDAFISLVSLRERKFKDFLGLVNEMYPNEKKEAKTELTNKLHDVFCSDLEIACIDEEYKHL